MANRHVADGTGPIRCLAREKRGAGEALIGRAWASLLLGLAIALVLTPTAAQEVCRPILAVTATRMSELQAPASGRLWFAAISVEASGCAADATGHFDVVVSRAKENAPEVVFRERFVWQRPSVTIGIDLAVDEAVADYRVDQVTPCPCSR
jgi:hypothetical protein